MSSRSKRTIFMIPDPQTEDFGPVDAKTEARLRATLEAAIAPVAAPVIAPVIAPVVPYVRNVRRALFPVAQRQLDFSEEAIAAIFKAP